MRRFFIQPQEIVGDSVYLSGVQAHHLRSVLRCQTGQQVELFDGSGNVYCAEIIALTPQQIKGRILSRHRELSASPFPLTLAQSVLKGNKMDFVLQKATELGVTTLIPVETRYSASQKNLERRRQRWYRIMLESCKQCGRLRPMQIAPAVLIKDLVPGSFLYRIIAWEGEEHRVIHADTFTVPGPVLLLIGPEGGFHKEEIQWAMENDLLPITLGPLTLRAETAAITALSIIQYLCRLHEDQLE